MDATFGPPPKPRGYYMAKKVNRLYHNGYHLVLKDLKIDDFQEEVNDSHPDMHYFTGYRPVYLDVIPKKTVVYIKDFSKTYDHSGNWVSDITLKTVDDPNFVYRVRLVNSKDREFLTELKDTARVLFGKE